MGRVEVEASILTLCMAWLAHDSMSTVQQN